MPESKVGCLPTTPVRPAPARPAPGEGGGVGEGGAAAPRLIGGMALPVWACCCSAIASRAAAAISPAVA